MTFVMELIRPEHLLLETTREVTLMKQSIKYKCFDLKVTYTHNSEKIINHRNKYIKKQMLFRCLIFEGLPLKEITNHHVIITLSNTYFDQQ